MDLLFEALRALNDFDCTIVYQSNMRFNITISNAVLSDIYLNKDGGVKVIEIYFYGHSVTISEDDLESWNEDEDEIVVVLTDQSEICFYKQILAE